MEDAENSLSSAAMTPRGRLRVDVPSPLARLILVPALPAFHARYPDIQIDMGVSDREVDLIGDNVDCVLRGGQITDQSLIARHVGDLQIGVYVAPSYVERLGAPAGIEWLDGFHEVLIYPAPFIVDDEWEDDIGLVHNQRVVQSGQSWQQGPVVLNWLDIQDSFDASGFNLVVHEVAHKLDTRNGDRASGVPLIPLREVAGWEHDLHAAMNNIQDEIDLVGESAASIDAYAATDPAECFAVLSEYFFSAPELFAPRFPALWQRFCHFYRQDPLARRRENGLQDEGDRRIVH
jgi:MtfA peptidase